MGIGKNRVFDAEQIQILINKTQNLMDTADMVINEIYSELCRLSDTLEKIPADIRDAGLKHQVDALKGSIRTDEFQNYRSKMTKSLNRLKENVLKEDKKLGGNLDVVAATVTNMTNRLRNLKELIPEGADTGSYEEFEKAFLECTRGWDTVNGILNRLLGQIVAVLKGGSNECVCLSDDPVNLSTGNFIYEKTDLKISGVPELAMTRFYNELDKQEGSMGRGWYHPYEVRLLIQEDIYTILLEDGKEEHFQKKKDGSFFGENTTSRLMIEEREEKQEVACCCYRTKQGESYHFNKEGQFYLWEDLTGKRLRLTYEENCLAQVLRETDGAYFAFTYNEAGRLIKVSDQTGRSASYTYDEEGRLHTVENPEGGIYQYAYDENGRIRFVTNPVGTVTVENYYDSQGRTVLQKFPDGGSMSYEYREKEKQVILTERNGSRITYCHDERYRNVRTIYEDGEEQFAYNRKGQRIRYRDCNGNTTRYSYDSRGNLTQVIDALGNKKNATYDSQNHLISLSLNGKERLHNHYDSEGKLTKSLDALGRETRFLYGVDGRVSGIIRADGSKLEITYDKQGNVVGIKDGAGGESHYSYDERNRLITAQDGEGNETSYTYDRNDRLTSIIDAMGGKKEFRYDLCGRRIEEIREDGKSICTKYNALGRPLCVTDALGYMTEYSYDAMWNISGIKACDGGETHYAYDKRNRLIRITDALGYVTEYGYDAAGNRTLVKGADGNSVYTAYDALNRMTSVTDAEGNTTSYEYDEQGNVTLIRDAAGGERRMEYDAAGQRLKETDPLGNTRSYTYNALGKIASLTDEAGRVTHYHYEEGGRLKSIKYCDGSSESYEYDKNGNLTQKTERNRLTTYYSYDKRNRLIEKESGDGKDETYAYDVMGRLTEITDALGQTTRYAYDAVGNLIKVTDVLGNDTCYTYDGKGGLLSVCRYEGAAGSGGKEERTMYVRDLCGRVVSMTDSLGQKEVYTYDEMGRLAAKCDREGYETRYAYTPGGKLAELLYADGRKAEYAYDPLGALKEVRDWLGITEIEHDALGRVLKVTDPYGKEISYEWGAAGERRKMVYPDGQAVRYEYNEAGQLAELIHDTDVVSYAYDRAGRLITKKLSNGIRVGYVYDEAGRLGSLIHEGEHLKEAYHYSYDAAGNRNGIAWKMSGAESTVHTYGYDEMNRLTEVYNEGKLLRSYAYDAFGNRVQKRDYVENAVKETTYVYNENNQLIKEIGEGTEKRYEYDKRGNLRKVMEGSTLLQEYEFDAADQMNRATLHRNGEIKRENYQYNGLGQRTVQELYSGIEDLNLRKRMHYTLDMTMPYHNLMSMEEELQERKQSFFWDGSVAFMEEAKEKNWYLQDALGSIRHLTDSSGRSRKAYVYDEFGMEQKVGGEGEEPLQPFGYAGYQWELLPGHYYAQARSYDAEIGRFLSEDPNKGEKGNPYTMNAYVYCWNRPLDMVDLDGKWPSGAGTGVSGMLINSFMYDAAASGTAGNGGQGTSEGNSHTAGIARELEEALEETAQVAGSECVIKTIQGIREKISMVLGELNFPGNVMDILNDLRNGDYSKESILNLLKDVISLMPAIGVLKVVDEVMDNVIERVGEVKDEIEMKKKEEEEERKKKKYLDNLNNVEILNSVGLKLSSEQLKIAQIVAAKLLEAGYEPEFVAGMLGNVLSEGKFGQFESSAYVTNPNNEPQYMKYMDEYYNYEKIYSGRSISEIGIDETQTLFDEVKRSEGMGKFGIGIIQWTDYERLRGLLEYYKNICGDNNYPTKEQCIEVETAYMIYELRESKEFKYIYDEWKSESEGLSAGERAKIAGESICKNYEKPKVDTSVERGGLAEKILMVMIQ